MDHSAQELAAIRQLMDDAQRRVEDDGRYFLAWGLISIAGLLFTYGAVRWQVGLPWLWPVWAILIGAGWGLGAWWGRRDCLAWPVRSIAGSLVADIWAGVGLGLTVLIFAGATRGAIALAATSGVVAALFGVGAFASASVYRQLPLRGMAFVWWASAAVMLAWPGLYSILLLALLTLALFVVPAGVLRSRARARAGPP